MTTVEETCEALVKACCTVYTPKFVCDVCGELTEVADFVIVKLLRNRKVPAVCHVCGDICLVTDNLIWEKVTEEGKDIEPRETE